MKILPFISKHTAISSTVRFIMTNAKISAYFYNIYFKSYSNRMTKKNTQSHTHTQINTHSDTSDSYQGYRTNFEITSPCVNIASLPQDTDILAGACARVWW